MPNDPQTQQTPQVARVLTATTLQRIINRNVSILQQGAAQEQVLMAAIDRIHALVNA